MDDLFQLVDREVWIITSADGERRGGLVATWVQPSSLDPADPIVTVSISHNHFTRELIDASGVFGLHLIAEDQIDLAFNFCCDSGRERDKLAAVKWRAGTTGCPLLTDCIAAGDCRVVDRHDAAGRVFYFAEIVASHVNHDARPLTEQGLLRSANAHRRAALAADREADIQVMRQAVRSWRERRASRS